MSDEHRRRRRRRGRGRRRRGRGCKSAGGAPTFRRPCCPGLVFDARGRCAAPCSPNGSCCPDGSICAGGVCSPCPWGQRCNGTACVCDGQSCPNGCCDAQQNCHSGNAPGNCGNVGNACVSCANPNPVCANKTCTTCAADRPCSSGCCNLAAGPDLGTCQPGTADTACGSSGVCTSCTGSRPTCGANGTCVCSGNSCGTGCCDGTHANPGTRTKPAVAMARRARYAQHQLYATPSQVTAGCHSSNLLLKKGPGVHPGP